MLTSSLSFLVTYQSLEIEGKTYQLPVLQNRQLKKFQKKIKERRKIIRQGYRQNDFLSKLMNKKEKITVQERLQEIKLLIEDYKSLTYCLQEYQKKYYNLVLILSEELSQLFIKKYQELNNLEQERIKLEIKNQSNLSILTQLNHEKQENLQATLLLGKTSFLMLEKLKLLGKEIQKLGEQTKQKIQNIETIVKELKVYEEISQYQEKAQNFRQEIATIAQKALDFPNYLQDFLSPFHNLLDEAIKIDEAFYGMVSEIKDLIDQIFYSEINEFNLPMSENFSNLLLDFLVNSYQQKVTMNEDNLKSLLYETSDIDLQLSEKLLSLYPTVEELFNHLSHQFILQKQLWQAQLGVLITPNLKSLYLKKNNHLIPYISRLNIEFDYSKLQKLLEKSQWKSADLETTYLLLKVIGKPDWNKVYPQDIQYFPIEAIQKIDQLWIQYSHGYFGFTIQERIWSEIGGQEDYETAKKLGNRLGWRKNGEWLEYEQLIFELSSTTPWGHLPVNWLIYNSSRSALDSIDIASVGAWRVDSWLIWQLNLFLSRVRHLRTLSQ